MGGYVEDKLMNQCLVDRGTGDRQGKTTGVKWDDGIGDFWIEVTWEDGIVGCYSLAHCDEHFECHGEWAD